MAIINLNNLSGISANFLKELKRYDRVFKENIFMETILEDISLLSLVIGDGFDIHYNRTQGELIAFEMEKKKK